MLAKVFGKKCSGGLFSLILLCAIFSAIGTARIFAQAGDSEQAAEVDQDEAVALFGRGQDAHEKGDLAGAIKLYENSLKLFPEFPEAEYQRGAALLGLGKSAEAESAFRRAAELRSDWSLPAATLGALLVKRNNFAEAEKFLFSAITVDANNSPAFVALAELRLRTSAAPEVLKSLLAQIRGLTNGKTNAPAAIWAARGSLERALGDRAAAKKSLALALAANSQNTIALVERARIFAAEADFNSALEDAQSAAKFSTADEKAQAQVFLAEILAAGGNYTEALKTLDALDSQTKSAPEAVNLRNTILANTASGAEAIASLEKLLASDEKNVAILSRLCNLSRTANPTKALDYCRRAYEIEPNANFAVGYGAALVQARQFVAAAELFGKILAAAPDNYTARANLAVALYEMKNYPAAIIEFQKIIETKPEIAASYFFLATAFDASQDYVSAMAAYQKFLQIADPKQNQLEIEKTNLRLPSLAKQVEKGAGKKKKP